MAERVERAVRALPSRLRLVVLARYLERGPDEQKARALKICPKSYRVRLSEAHHWLDGWLKGGGCATAIKTQWR